MAFPSLPSYQERELRSFQITPGSAAMLKTNIRWHLLEHGMCGSVEAECTLQSVLSRCNLRFVSSCKTLVAVFEKSFALLGACLGSGALLLHVAQGAVPGAGTEENQG